MINRAAHLKDWYTRTYNWKLFLNYTQGDAQKLNDDIKLISHMEKIIRRIQTFFATIIQYLLLLQLYNAQFLFYNTM